MRHFWLFLESIRFAGQALRSNLLRTVLSLLGVTVGIFAIIAVFTLVDGLERGIRDSVSFLGDRVIYVQKWPWSFGPNYPWWKYVSRPEVGPRDYRALQNYLPEHDGLAMFASTGNRALRYESRSLDGVGIQGITFDFNRVSDVRLAQGRYFIPQEIANGRPVALIGADIARDLFGEINPEGQQMKLRGLYFTVVGVLEKQGESLISAGMNVDMTCMIPYSTFTKLFGAPPFGPTPIVAVKGFDDDADLMQLEGDIRGVMRSVRSLKPRQEDNFALNRPEMVADQITRIFSVLGVVGWVIGSFAMLVGGFGIANIMFVSVRERTNLIGVQKALGARQAFILYQFLFEAIFLSIIGGLGGLSLVWLLTFVPIPSLELRLSADNILLGLGVSAIIGVIAGIVPALMAARLDPVEAIRSK